MLAKEIPSKDPSYYTKPVFDEVAGEDDITKMQYADIRTWLVQDILVKADRMSMANSLELRVPFLDKEMLKIALQIPSKYRIDNETTKVALRRAAAKEYFNTAYIMKLLDDHKAGTAHNMKKIWSIYSFLLWYEKYFIEN